MCQMLLKHNDPAFYKYKLLLQLWKPLQKRSNCFLKSLILLLFKIFSKPRKGMVFISTWHFPFSHNVYSKRMCGKELRVTAILHGSVVKCSRLMNLIKALGSGLTGSSGLFLRVSLGKTPQSPSLALVKPRKYMSIWAVAMTWLK